MKLQIGDKVINPELSNDFFCHISGYKITEESKLSPNYVGIITKIENYIFATVQFRDYSANLSTMFLTKTN